MSSKLCEEIVIGFLSKKRLMPKKKLALSIITLEEYHTLGKRIVSAVLRSSGYELIDYGTVLEPEEIGKKCFRQCENFRFLGEGGLSMKNEVTSMERVLQ